MVARIVVSGSECTITRIGLGCARLRGGPDVRTSHQLLETALKYGIKHFDTAPAYGTSEAILGEVVAGVEGVTIATKIGIARAAADARVSMPRRMYRRWVMPALTHIPRLKAGLLKVAASLRHLRHGSDATVVRRVLSREEILRGIEESLRNLRRSSVDIYLVHEPDQFELTDETKQVFQDLLRDGTIRSFGLAFGRVPDFGTGFGTVTQGRLPLHQEPASSSETRIFHGLLRHSWPTGLDGIATDPGVLFARVLASRPHDAVIFSASQPHQIQKLMQEYQRAVGSTG